jgi:hypothetical protein
MNTNEPRATTAHDRVILDVEGARDVGPTEAAGLIRECLALTYKRFDAATWRALDELESAAPNEAEAPPGAAAAETPAVKIARAVRRERSKFFSRFRSEFDQLFQARRANVPRPREQRGQAEAPLALVNEGDLAGQVALKTAVRAMHTATREEGFGFDLRTRIVMRERPSDTEFRNPWGAELVCDALGNTCRNLWAADGAWRPVMEHLVRALTPEVVALHGELDQLFQDRDILPVLRVRTRKRTAARGGHAPGGGSLAAAAGTAEAPEVGDLYHQVVQMLASDAQHAAPRPQATAATANAATARPPVTDPLDFGEPEAWRAHPSRRSGDMHPARPAADAWQTLQRALALLAREEAAAAHSAGTPAARTAVLHEDTQSVLPVLDAAVAAAGDAPLDRVTVEIVSAVLDEVFDNAYLPPEVKAIFGRLQIPILKASLLDPQVLSNPRHHVRRFFDTLAAASVGARPDIAHDVLFLELAAHLAAMIRDRLSDGGDAFANARDELDTFLDAERAAYNQKLAQALPMLTALDDDATARTRARTAIAMRVAGRALPPEIRDYLEQEGLARLSTIGLRDGADSPAWKQELDMVDTLVWSFMPDRVPGARNRLLQVIPPLVRNLSEGWPTDESSRARRKVFLARLYELHVEALNTPFDLPELDADEPAPPIAATPAPDRVQAQARDESVADVESLSRGDWCAFDGEDGEPTLLAKFAWRAPQGTQLLFTHRDGSIALIHTPESLAQAFRGGRARVAVEAIPLFERAMEKLLERRGGAGTD